MQTWLLIDCNNFFVSCERVFRPELENKPVLVLSSNDGCVVSRSNEVKQLGIQMGVPHYQIKDLIKKHQISVFSSNFPLYSNLSNRVFNIAKKFSPHYEIYSIDECFLCLPSNSFSSVKKWEDFSLRIKKEIQQATGIPVTIGIGASKTQAKLATEISKKDPLSQGVLSFALRPEAQLNSFLAQVDINDVWGIGRQTTKQLLAQKVTSALDFYQKDRGWVVQHYKTMGEKVWLELHGQPCIFDEEADLNKRQMLCSRSFGEPITKLADLKQAVADYTAQAASRLRRQHARASFLTVFIRTSYFIDPIHRYSASKTASLPIASSFTPELISTSHQLLAEIFKPGYVYKKAGIIFSHLENEINWQPPLLEKVDHQTEEKHQALMTSLDQLNRREGREIVRFASQSKSYEQVYWHSSTKFRSPNYTGNWEQLPKVK